MSRPFPLGRVVATPGALALVDGPELHALIDRHAAGDWGTVCEDDARANDDALTHGTRVLSAYDLPATEGRKAGRLWILTEADRSSTTALLPDEY